jgi:glyoxylase-like metal-dependent hydrolase (beta-lactamase superfamily II)
MPGGGRKGLAVYDEHNERGITMAGHVGNRTIFPIPLFRSDVRFEKPKMTYLTNYGEDLHICCSMWFIQGTTEKIMIDAGGTIERAMVHGRLEKNMTQVQTMEHGLAKLHLEPKDIDTVIFTHLHWDHVEMARQFVKARFIVQKEELDFAFRPHDVAAAFYDKELFEGLDFHTIEGDCEIADGIRVLPTPGHSVGCQSVAIETEKGIAVLTGFCCIRENFSPDLKKSGTTGIIMPGIHLNAMQAYDSMLMVKETADIIIPNHDPEFASMEKIP